MISKPIQNLNNSEATEYFKSTIKIFEMIIPPPTSMSGKIEAAFNIASLILDSKLEKLEKKTSPQNGWEEIKNIDNIINSCKDDYFHTRKQMSNITKAILKNETAEHKIWEGYIEIKKDAGDGVCRGALNYRLPDVIGMNRALSPEEYHRHVQRAQAGAELIYALNDYKTLRSFEFAQHDRANIFFENNEITPENGIKTKEGLFDFRNRNLKEVKIPADIFQKSDFSNANLGAVDIFQQQLSDINFTNTLMNLDLSRLYNRESDIDLFLNHYNNPNGTLLTALQSIDVRFAEFKVQLGCEILNKLTSMNVTLEQLINTALPVLEIFGREPFTDDPKLRQWHNELAKAWLSANKEISTQEQNLLAPATISTLLHLMSRDAASVIGRNALFHQLVHLAAADPGLTECVQENYNRYLQHKEIAPYTHFEHFSRTTLPSEPVQVDLQESDAVNLILMPTKPDGPVLLMSLDTLRGMLNPDSLNPVWNHFYQMDTPLSCLKAAEINPESLFRRNFPQFLAPFLHEKRKITSDKLLAHLDLGQFHEAFVRATEAESSTDKLIDLDSETKLDAHFRPMLRSGSYWSKLTQQHTQMLLQNYQIGDASRRTKSEHFLCLSAVFARLSSSYCFGTETDSPIPLRIYAHALLLQASEFDQTIFTSPSQFEDWQNRFQGNNQAFPCSAVLSQMMFDHAKNVCPETLSIIRPLAWS